MMSGRTRLVKACGAKRGLRRAAIGALVSSSFAISREGNRYSVKFENVLAEDGSSLSVTLRGLDKTEVDQRLGPYLTERKRQGCIAPGIALPWPALLRLIGGAFSIEGERSHVDIKTRRARSAAEQLKLTMEELSEIPMRLDDMWSIGDERMIDFCGDRMCERAAAGVKTDDALAGHFRRILKMSKFFTDPVSTIRAVLPFYIEFPNLSEPPPPEDKVRWRLEATREMARDFNQAMTGEQIDEKVMQVIEETTPDLCFNAVFTKLRSIFDARVVKRWCEATHGAVLKKSLFHNLEPTKHPEPVPARCTLCRLKIREAAAQFQEAAARIKEEAAATQKQLAHLKRVQQRMWDRSR